jgi:quercetin dioxygenase-like cupin family protein
MTGTPRQAPRAGDVITNPIYGDTVRWLQIGSETSATRLELTVYPQASGPPAHKHPKSYERFEVVSGAVRLKSGREERVIEPGEKVTVPPGSTHTWHNHTDDPAVVVVEMDPGFSFAEFIDEWYELARAGRLNSKGDLSFLQSAVLFHPHVDAIAVPGIPLGLQRALMRGLSWFARQSGLEA